MKNLTYWEKRVARQMFEYVEDAEKTGRFIRQGYMDALQYLQQEAVKVFDKFQSRYGLTRKEAEVLLQQMRTPEDIELLKRLIAQNPERTDLIAELEAGAYGNRLNRLADMMAQVDKKVFPISAATVSAGQSLYSSLAQKAYLQSMFNLQQYAGYGWNVAKISDRNINAVLETIWNGRDFSSRTWENANALADRVKRELLLNVLTGRPLHAASQALARAMNAGYNDARRVIRTESTMVCNEMQRRSYEECGVKKYIYIAILDLRTSVQCRELDKKVFDLAQAKPGINYPPMHPYCRSTTIANITSDVLHRMRQRALDPKTGRHVLVPSDMTYQQWFRKFVLEAEEDITEKR